MTLTLCLIAEPFFNQKGEFEKAIADYSKVIESADEDPDVFRNRALSYQKKGRIDWPRFFA